MQTNSLKTNTKRSALMQEFMRSFMAIGRSGPAGEGGYLLREYGFSLPQLPMLFHVSNSENGATIKEIAGQLNITSSAATQLVQTLLRRGVLQKQSDPNDHRAVRIRLSPKGNREFAAFREGMLNRFAHVFQAVPDAELQEMISVFKKIITYIKPLNPTKNI